MIESDIATEAGVKHGHQRVEELRRSFDEGMRRSPDEEVAQTENFLLLTLAEESYAFPVANALEILQVPPIIPLPGVPPTVLGIINLRGRILSVSTIHAALGLRPVNPRPSSRIIVTKNLPLNTGILVDGVEGMAEIVTADIQRAHTAVGSDKACLLAGEIYIDEKLVAVLDMEQLCASESLRLPGRDSTN